MSVVDRLWQLHHATHQGEWFADAEQVAEDDGNAEYAVIAIPHATLPDACSVLFKSDWGVPADAEWIVAAHEHWPALLDVVEAANDVVGEWQDPTAEPPSETYYHDLVVRLEEAVDALAARGDTT